jgi:hypothetical protein
MEMESYQESSPPFLVFRTGTLETVFIITAIALAVVAGWTSVSSHPSLLSFPSIAVAL